MMDAQDIFDTLPTYGSWRPTAMDVAGLALGDRQDWRVMPVSRTRDSGPLDESNFATALRALGGEDEHVEVHRFGHWGPGWFEIIIVSPDAPEGVLITAGEIVCALESYPVLDEHDYSEREEEIVLEAWNNMSFRERIRMCADRGISIFAARHDTYPDAVRDQLID